MGDSVKGLAVLGSTGSIGRQTLEVAHRLADRFRVVGLAAGHNVPALREQIEEFSPAVVCCEDVTDDLRDDFAFAGAERVSLDEMASHPDVDIVVVATAGKVGLAPTLAALRVGKVVALANKEALVMAGSVITRAAAGAQIRPIDSEHSAIWQCLWGEDRANVSRIILTASGGAFRDRSAEELAQVTPDEALRHPTWQMGRKVTIDSATLFNKGLEAIEARWLFGVPLENIEVVLHRESVVHSLVEFVDGCTKAQLGVPDMRIPIQCALCYPERLAAPSTSRLDFVQMGDLHFDALDLSRYPCLALALEAGRRGGTYPAALAAADEVAVEHFLAGHIRFTDIPGILERALAAHDDTPEPTLDDILEADARARHQAEDWVKAKA
jgi:1-deoxy-D-xylulose-5-phosphate reductoisomerase